MELPWPVWSGWGCELPRGQDVKSPITCNVNSKCKWSLSFPETLCMAGKEQHCPKTSFMETLGKERIALQWHPSVLGSKLSSPNQKNSVVSPSLSLTLSLLCPFRPKILLANIPSPLHRLPFPLFSAENMFLLQTIDQTSPLLLTFLLLYSQFKNFISYPLWEFLNSCSQIPLVIIY